MKKLALIYVAIILISMSGVVLADEVKKTEEVKTDTRVVLTDVTDIDWGIGDDDSSSGYD